MLHVIANMRSVVELCQTRQPLPEPLAAWLADSLQAFLERETPSLNDAFGVRNARGGIPWRTEACIRQRDEALRSLAATFMSNFSIAAQAGRIHQLSSRYAASTWRFDRERSAPPPSYHGTAHEMLWFAFKSGATMPLCKRQLRTILSR